MSNKAIFSLYFSSDNTEIYQLLKDYRLFHKQMLYNVDFEVFYVTYTSDEYVTDNTKNTQRENCLTAGKYCAQPRYDLNILDGRDIVTENIRQKCIFKISYQQDLFLNDYFTYMNMFYERCLLKDSFSEYCALNALSRIDGIDFNDVTNCIGDSYKTELTDRNKYIIENSILEEDRKARSKYTPDVFPGILINKTPLEGSYSSYNVFESICGVLSSSVGYCSTGMLNNESSNNNGDLSTGSIFLVIMLVIFINIIIVYFCKKYIVKKMHEKIESSEINGKINNVVTSYLALRDTK